MDTLQVSGIAVLLLTEFFKSAVSESGKKTIGSLLELIRVKFKGKKEAEKSLNDFQESPDDAKKQLLVKEQIKIEMLGDEKFASLLTDLVNNVLTNSQTIFNNDIDEVNTLIQINTLNGNINL